MKCIANKSIRVFILMVIISLTLSSCTRPESEPLKVGVAGPHSGDLASYGLPSVKAAELVVNEINAKGGILGRNIELLIEDDVCKPELATNTATKLVSQKVHIVLGHICSGATKAALGIYKDSKIIAISPSATNPDLTQSGNYPNFFRTIASDDAQAKLEVDFALDVEHQPARLTLNDIHFVRRMLAVEVPVLAHRLVGVALAHPKISNIIKHASFFALSKHDNPVSALCEFFCRVVCRRLAAAQ